MVKADTLINDAINAAKIPGAVLLVGRRDAILYEKAYGNRALKPTTQPMTTDTVFDLASLTKPLATATSIMILNERGKLKLADPVAKYLPAFAANGKQDITIEDLLLHVGGLIPDNDMTDFADGAEVAMKKIFALAAAYPPRSRFAYSDVGYIVLAEVVRAADGRSIDLFARDEIYRPLGMADTSYRPADSIKSRCAPTQERDGHWMIGEVHDPRAYALGGVAGHAGLFSTAEDLSRFCRMLIGGGQLGSVRILKQSTMDEMLRPHPVPGPSGGLRAYGFDIDTAYSGPRGDRFERGVTFGHTGFTGTAFWIDPINGCYYVLLANSVHPDGKGSAKKLRHEVANVVGEAFGIAPSGTGFQPVSSATLPATSPSGRTQTRAGSPCHVVLLGIDILKRDNFNQVAHRKIALITNQTGRDRDGNRTIDLLAGAKNLQLVKLFSPEHGIDGLHDEKVPNTTDARTGLPIISLYGSAQKPTPAMLEGIDTLVFDIQDVGCRFYTYITTMGLCMQTAAERHIRFVVLDRPNPNTGLICDGPPADKSHFGFTAFGPLPLVHGMTVGELALLFNAEFKINCDLQVIPMENWRRRMWWDDTGLMWINPSPNLRNPTAALLYPAIGLLEATDLSVGRGTDLPFEVFGAPWINGRQLATELNELKLSGVRFVPIQFEPKSSKFAGQRCEGVYVQVIDRNAFEPAQAGYAIVRQLRIAHGDHVTPLRIAKMLQNSDAVKLLTTTDPAGGCCAWHTKIAGFRAIREKYLLYQ